MSEPIVSLPACDGCKSLDDVDRRRRNSQFDIIYCDECKEPFERRLKPWHCPHSPLVKKTGGKK